MGKRRVMFGASVPDDFEAIADYAREAESLGFDRLSLGEHIMDGSPPRPTVMSIPGLAAAGGATRSIRLLTGIVLIPLYHPVMLAKMATTLDVVSGGRLDLGIGVGGQRNTRGEFEAMGVPVEERGRRANEAIQLVTRLWTEEHVSFDGRFFRCKDVTLSPSPSQKPHPPIWVAGREDASMRRAGRYGDGWYPYLFTLRRLKASMEKVREEATAVGKDLSGFRWGLLQPICIANTRESALQIAAANVGQRYVTSERSAEDIAQALCIAGTAKDCIRQIEERVNLGVTDITLQWIAPNLRSTREQMQIASQDILPYFEE